MGLFVRKSCVALAWSPSGQCWGVHLRRRGDQCVVALFWHGEHLDGHSLAARLAEGFRCLGAKENTIVVGGGHGCRCGFAEVDLPNLTHEDMRNAVRFELNQVAPIAVDKLVWGYRLLPCDAHEQRRVRLIYMRETEWAKWIDAVSGFAHGIDIVIPPEAVLDPLFADREALFRDPDTDSSFLLAPRSGGGRDIRREEADGVGIFGAPPEPISLPYLDPGGLGSMPVEEQCGYSSAILLGLYGLTKGPEVDARTWAAVPYELRPRRHRYSRMLAAVLILVLLGVATLMIGREYQAANTRFLALQREHAELERQLQQEQEPEDVSQFVALLEKEFNDAYVERPTLAQTLIELTRLIDGDAWVLDFRWTDGKVDLELSVKEEQLDLLPKLDASPILADVGPRGVQRRGSEITQRLELNARFDVRAEAVRALEDAEKYDPLAPTAETVPESAPVDDASTSEGLSAPDTAEMPVDTTRADENE